MVFDGPPKPPLTYSLAERLVRFPILLTISVQGMKILYGDDYDPGKITKDEYHVLNEYLASIGMSLKYNLDGTKAAYWFELWKDNKTCHGALFIT